MIIFLVDYFGKGEVLIFVGLDSFMIRNRNIVIRVLDKWKVGNWLVEIMEKIN